MGIARVTEKSFMATVVELAKLRGWKVFHVFDSRRCVAGFPDLLLIRGTQLIVAELKVGRNTATAEQVEWLRAFEGAAVTAHVWYPEMWDVIEKVLA